MKIFQLIDFTKNHAVLNRIRIESCYEGNAPHFEGSVIELIKTQFLFLNVSVENANYDEDHAQLNIFYNPEDL